MLSAGELLRTEIPVRRTSSGKRGSASATRFCTSTWARSRSVPTSNVTVSCIVPSLIACDVIYSMLSTPFTSCSIGVATVSAIVCALAPGYVAVTTTVGGAISGWRSIGRFSAAMIPTTMIVIETTAASTGRSVK